MNVKDVVFGIAIIILTIFVTYYGINTIFPGVDYNEFCTPDRYNPYINTSVQCENAGGKWNPSYYEGNYAKPIPVEGSVEGYCDLDYYCRQDYEKEQKIRSRNVFFIALPLGILIIAGGAFFFGLEYVGAGLMGGGVGTLIYGSGAYWPYTENWVRFILSLLGLILLIWLAYFLNKRMQKKDKGKKKR